MRLSYQWLSEYLDLPPVEEVARRLTAVGLEVEAVARRGEGLAGVVVARIVASERHPAADRLSITRVDAGGEPLQVVCGATNYRVGDLVPLATVGAVLPGGQRIEAARLRGVESAGMLCSARELGLSDEAGGLLLLDPGLAPGASIAAALGLDDAILEVNVTPNRPDALSHLGVARELAALLGVALRPPRAAIAEAGAPAAEALRVRIEAPERCHRYAARVVEGVRVGPSPAWLARRLEACGVRSISNVVDATNLVLLELGHPLHAFDLDRVAGAEIVVRAARPGERLTTLDGKDRALDPDDLLVADRDRGSALAGVMGGGDSEISAGTRRVLVESAWFEPAGVRRTSKRHGLKTEASYRFERGADPGMVGAALDRCAALIAELAGGAVRPGVVEAHPRPHRPAEVRLRWARVEELLGLPVPGDEIRRILGGLGFSAAGADGEGATFAVPSWRQDVAIEEDLVEEVVRTLGYDAIPETLPRPGLDTPAPTPESVTAARVRDALEAAGFAEAINFSFVAPAEDAAVDPGARPVALRNPISAELGVLRSSLLPSLLRNAATNLRRHVTDLRLYELARAFGPSAGSGDAPVLERGEVAGLLLGRRSPPGWAASGEPVDLHDARAAVEAVLEALGVAPVRWEGRAEPWCHPRHAAAVVGEGGIDVGTVAELHPRVAAAFDLPRATFAFRLDLAALGALARPVARYHPIPRFPAVLRDLAVVVDEPVEVARVVDAIRAEPLVEAATLFDLYRGAPLPAGRKSLALAIRYRSPERTLTDTEVDAGHRRIVARLAADVGAVLRG